MPLSDMWFVEYSPSQKQFFVKRADIVLSENLTNLVNDKFQFEDNVPIAIRSSPDAAKQFIEDLRTDYFKRTGKVLGAIYIP